MGLGNVDLFKINYLWGGCTCYINTCAHYSHSLFWFHSSRLTGVTVRLTGFIRVFVMAVMLHLKACPVSSHRWGWLCSMCSRHALQGSCTYGICNWMERSRYASLNKIVSIQQSSGSQLYNENQQDCWSQAVGSRTTANREWKIAE